MEKQRILDIKGNNQKGEQLVVNITTDTANRVFSISDLGIGFTYDQLQENIGTIANSGTKKFTELLRKSQETGSAMENLIGQFGVGFYSSFVVSDKVEIFTKSEESESA